MDMTGLRQRFTGLLRRGRRLLADILYPDGILCLCCGKETDGSLLCGTCAGLLAESREGVEPPPSICPECISLWRHDGPAQQLVLMLKQQGAAAAAEVLGQGMAAGIPADSLPENTVVTWVTMPASRLRSRPCDHGRLLAEQTAAALTLPVRQLLYRADREEEHTQRGLSRQERLVNLTGLFTAEPLHGETVLLIDDVMTTGATGAVCRDTLLQAGAGRVLVVTATRAPHRQKDADAVHDPVSSRRKKRHGKR